MRILYIVPDLVIGGVTSVVLSNIKELQNRNCNILLVSLSDTNEFKQDNLSIKSLNIPPKDIVKFIISLNSFHSIVQEFKPEIIHSHTYNANIYIRLYSMIYSNSIIKICNEHGTIQFNSLNLRYILYRYTKKLQDHYTNVSQNSLNSYVKYGLFDSKNSSVLYNGVDTDKYKINSSKDLKLFKNDITIFGYIGRLSKEKDPLNLIEAVTYLRSITNKKFKVIIVGNGPEMESIKKSAVNSNITHLVSFVGMQKDIIPYLEQIDTLVLPSKTEGLPTIILEAMSMEKLVVSTDCGGVREIFSGIKSFIVDIENPQELALAMHATMKLTLEQRYELGLTYRKQILKNFSINSTSQRVYDLYKLLLLNK